MDNQRILLAQQSMALEAARAAGRGQVALAVLIALVGLIEPTGRPLSKEDKELHDELSDEALRIADRLIERAGKRPDGG